MSLSAVVTEPSVTSKATDSDELVERAKAGEISAFEMLYRQNVNKVYSLCYRMTVNKAIAEELTQEAFVRLWQKLHLFNGNSAFTTWLHRLVTNLVISEMRRKNLLDSLDDFDSLLNQHAHNQAETAVGMDLEAAIVKLPAGARQIFVLHDVEGYKHAEIADLLEIAEGTSKTQLHRSRKLLREWMQ